MSEAGGAESVTVEDPLDAGTLLDGLEVSVAMDRGAVWLDPGAAAEGGSAADPTVRMR